MGYSSITIVVTDAFTKLVENPKTSNDKSQEISIIKARLEETQRHNETLKIHNETLKAELESANKREEYLKTLYNNYIRQMQTLIQQKAIEAPGTKKPWWKIW